MPPLTDLVDELRDADDVVGGAVEDGDAEHAARREAVRLGERRLHAQPLRHAAHVQDLQRKREGRSLFKSGTCSKVLEETNSRLRVGGGAARQWSNIHHSPLMSDYRLYVTQA